MTDPLFTHMFGSVPEDAAPNPRDSIHVNAEGFAKLCDELDSSLREAQRLDDLRARQAPAPVGEPVADAEVWVQVGFLKEKLSQAEVAAETWKDRAMAFRLAQPTPAPQVPPEVMRQVVEALAAELAFARGVADAVDIDDDDTVLAVRVMPEGRQVAERSWADVHLASDAALTAVQPYVEGVRP